MRFRNARRPARSKTGRVTTNSAPASTLYSKRRSSSSRFGAAGFTDTPMWNAVGAPIGWPPTSQPWLSRDTTLVRPIESTSNTAVASGIVADAARIAGDEQQVAQAHRVRAEQVRLDAEQVPIAAGVVQQRLDAGLLLDEHGQRQRADPRAGPLAVGNVDRRRRRGSSARARARSPASDSKPRGGSSSTTTTNVPARPARAARRDFCSRGTGGASTGRRRCVAARSARRGGTGASRRRRQRRARPP